MTFADTNHEAPERGKQAGLPLVSYCLTTYNQKRFVADAVRSALAQTYPNLEILISDDASTDGTDSIIRELVETYREQGGKHAVRFLAHEKNVGFSRNISRCFGEAKGELIVEAHDDDIAHPERAAKIAEAWLATGKKATAIVHGWKKIDPDGNILGEQAPWGEIKPWKEISHDVAWLRTLWPLGAVMAFVPGVVKQFGPIVETGGHDDCIWLVRAMILGCPYYIPDRLLFYRVGSGATTSVSAARRGQKALGERGVAAGRQNLMDLESFKDKMPAEWHAGLVKLVKKRTADFDHVHRCFTSTRFWEKLWLLATSGNLMMQSLPPRLISAPFILLPNRIGDVWLNRINAVHVARKRKAVGERVVVGDDGQCRIEKT